MNLIVRGFILLINIIIVMRIWLRGFNLFVKLVFNLIVSEVENVLNKRVVIFIFFFVIVSRKKIIEIKIISEVVIEKVL